jgi:hypothetical protein
MEFLMQTVVSFEELSEFGHFAFSKILWFDGAKVLLNLIRNTPSPFSLHLNVNDYAEHKR